MDREILDAALRTGQLRSNAPSSVAGLFLDELFEAADGVRQAQMDLEPLIAFNDAPYLMAQGPTLPAIVAVADFHRETDLGSVVGLIRDVILQVGVTTDDAWRIEPGLYVTHRGVHFRSVPASVKVSALAVILSELGHKVSHMPIGMDVPDDIMLPLPELGWRRAVEAGVQLH